MKTLISCIALLITFTLSAQDFSQSIPPGVIKNLTSGDSTTTNLQLQHDYIIEAKVNNSGYVEIKLKSSLDTINEQKFSLKPLTLELFVSKFKINFKKLVKISESMDSINVVWNEVKLSILFAQLTVFERTTDERPIVANISLLKNIPVKIYYANDSTDSKINKGKKKKPPFHVEYLEDAQLEMTFYNGFIEKVELAGLILGTAVRFRNKYSIGISSSRTLTEFSNHFLESFNTYEFVPKDSLSNTKQKIIKKYTSDNKLPWPLEINFADVIDYDRELDINANDISPEPTKLVLTSKHSSTKLYKPESTKLFKAVVFSDFFGLFDEENPNGIIQTEVEKKFYINTRRKYERFSLWHLLPFSWYSNAYGLVEYVNIKAKFSKIEDNNKFLSPIEVGSASFFSPLRIKQFESLSIGTDINIVSYENQNRKINTHIDIGWYYGRSGLKTSEESVLYLNTTNVSANVSFHIIPEKRYGLIASNRISYYTILNDDAINEMDGLSIQSMENGELGSPNRWFNSSQFEFYLDLSSTGKLFIRYNLVTDLVDWDNNFSKFQFGYSFNILKQNGKIK